MGNCRGMTNNLGSVIKIGFVFFIPALITNTASAIWGNSINTPLMFKADKVILDILIPLELEEFDRYIYPDRSLISFARNGQLEKVVELLERGADPSLTNREGNTAVWFANQYNDPNVAASLEAVIKNHHQKKNQ